MNSPQGTYGVGHSRLHGWYETLRQPGSGMSCCNDQDCRPTMSRIKGKGVQVKVDGAWVDVPADKILQVPSPDLGSHVCAPKQEGLLKGHLFCVILGSGV